jgi:hypothetical protein
VRKILTTLALAAAATGATVALAGPASATQPTTTTHNITIDAASGAFVDLPALNSQFTTMVLTADGTAHWGGPDGDTARSTSYTNGILSTTYPFTSGFGPGPILLEGAQVGAVIYRVDGGEWQPLLRATTIDPAGNGTHHVQVAYNDRPDAPSYADNFGSLNLNIVRSRG